MLYSAYVEQRWLETIWNISNTRFSWLNFWHRWTSSHPTVTRLPSSLPIQAQEHFPSPTYNHQFTAPWAALSMAIDQTELPALI